MLGDPVNQGKWQRLGGERGGCTKVHGLLALIIVGLTIALIVTNIKSSPAPTPSPADVCQTPSCISLASQLLGSMNTSVNPCEDFYEYSCGGWRKDNPVPDDKNSFSTFSNLNDRVQKVLRGLLAQPVSVSTSEAERQVRLIYQSCMDTDTINERGADPVKAVLNSLVIPSGPEPFSQADFESLSVLLGTLDASYGVSPIIDAMVGADSKNSSLNVVTASQPSLGLPDRSFYLNSTDPVLAQYAKFVSSIFTLIDFPQPQAAAQRVVAFESELAAITLSNVELRDPEKTYNVYSREDLTTLVSWLNLDSYLPLKYGDSHVDIKRFIVTTPKYFQDLEALLKNVTKDDVGAFLTFRFIASYVTYLSQDFLTVYQNELLKPVFGVSSLPARWQTCVGTAGSMGFATGELFVRATFATESKKIAEDMIKGVKDFFKKNLKNVPWMDDPTRVLAAEKADAVAQKIAYPDWTMVTEELDKYYSAVGNLSAGTYFENHVNLVKFENGQNADDLWKPVDKARWDMSPATVNAYYNPTNNEIVFPAAILQPPFFEAAAPKAANFGAMGVVMGHELTHGFDDQGAQFDKDGNLKPWWPPAITEAFKEKTMCMADQYSRYTVETATGIDHLDGNLTLGENIADNGGLKQAYHAYRDWVAVNAEEPKLPGMSLTPDQLFFVSFANVWCENWRPEAVRANIKTNPHSTGRYRVIGSVTNTPEFATAFNCPAGSPMNPTKRCDVW